MDQEQPLRRPLDDGSATTAVAAAATVPPLQQTEHHPPPPLEPTPDDDSGLYFGHRSCPPPAYTQLHDPASLSFPDAPKTELPPIQPQSDIAASANHNLPSLSSVTGPQPHLFGSPRTAEPSYSPEPLAATQWPSMNPLTTFYTPSHVQASDSPQRMDVDVGSNGRASSVSLDDPDVRMAAEALGDLRADFISSPPKGHTPLPSTSSPRSFGADNGPEPLFSLLTTSHPLIANTIDTANKAYTTSKKTYPRFKSGAEYIEGYLSPVASTVGSVGRATGVHGGIRWFLGAGRRHGSSSSDLETGSRKSQKRRKVDNKSSGEQGLDALADKAVAARSIANLDLYDFTRDRRNSISTVDTQDTLPAYDDTGRSPDYSDAPEPQNQVANRPNGGAAGPWQQRLIMSTSGLSIAMSKESLRSLKYCLQWLRWANEHIAKTIAALKSILQQYDGSAKPERTAGEGQEDREMTDGPESASAPADRNQLAARITELKSDVLKTLRDVIDTVSKYAGGALPDNARELVHRHLTSLPQRFRVATLQDASGAKKQGTGPEEQEQEVRDSAQRVLVLAREGLDMMEQVSGVLDGTIHSAEEWCQRLGKTEEGKKDAEGKEKEKSGTPVAAQEVPGAFPGVPTVQ